MGEEIDPLEFATNVRGFDPATVYRTYDEYVNDSERKYIEYFLRDAYEYYGYDFQYYDGQPMTIEDVDALTEDFTTLDHYIRETWRKLYVKAEVSLNGKPVEDVIQEQVQQLPHTDAGAAVSQSQQPAAAHDAQAGAGPGAFGAAAVSLRRSL